MFRGHVRNLHVLVRYESLHPLFGFVAVFLQSLLLMHILLAYTHRLYLFIVYPQHRHTRIRQVDFCCVELYVVEVTTV